jgi:3,4-dihydroxy 2-butanone 4-phosphate synthase/GTP cyclohydrolase II
MQLGDWIEQRGLSRSEVARQLGISPGHVTDLCAGRFWPSRAVAIKIWRLTDGAVTPNDFLTEGEKWPV